MRKPATNGTPKKRAVRRKSSRPTMLISNVHVPVRTITTKPIVAAIRRTTESSYQLIAGYRPTLMAAATRRPRESGGRRGGAVAGVGPDMRRLPYRPTLMASHQTRSPIVNTSPIAKGMPAKEPNSAEYPASSPTGVSASRLFQRVRS